MVHIHLEYKAHLFELEVSILKLEENTSNSLLLGKMMLLLPVNVPKCKSENHKNKLCVLKMFSPSLSLYRDLPMVHIFPPSLPRSRECTVQSGAEREQTRGLSVVPRGPGWKLTQLQVEAQ